MALLEFLPSHGSHPPGATVTDDGVHFAVYSRQAHAVDVCLFDAAEPQREIARARLIRDGWDMWRGFLRGVKPGAVYGFRAHGPWQPEHGLWFNPNKLLLDPYARAVTGDPKWNERFQNLRADGGACFHDSSRVALKSVIVRDEFDWQGDAPPLTPWPDTVVYEMHVRGFTKKHPGVPAELRGTYAGLAHPASIAHLRDLGVTAVQLLPVHLHLNDGFLLKRQLTNYWGYNTLGFFAPHHEYAAAREPQAQVDEFKAMVRELHRAGIEVILDVVYNHTAEGDENGPLLSFRGLDNPGYHLLNHEARVMNYTGCGNTVNAASPPALRLILDSLRYWAREMHVDGFRFDLAATMGRRGEAFDRDAPFFQAIAADPVLARVKLIAEPWDIGPNGYQVGGFPKPWHELNGRFRDKARHFWRGDSGFAAAFAKRLCGSDDIYGSQGKNPHATVNFFTSHDGFTLRDLWSYDHKHNEANGENNQDGDNANHGWNCGVEGETKDAAVNALRRRLARASIASIFCSLGVPFLYMGDERWRTQGGNNNGYCQDNEVSWMDWADTRDATRMTDFVKQMIRFRREHSALRRHQHFNGRINPFTGHADVEWFDENGQAMTHEKWYDASRHFFAGRLDAPDAMHANHTEKPFFLIFNSGGDEVPFPLPAGCWRLVFDTSREPSFPKANGTPCDEMFPSAPRSVACLVLDKPASSR